MRDGTAGGQQFTVYSLQFTACWLKSVPSKVFAMVVRDGTAGGKERELIVYSLQLAKGGEGERL